MQNDTLHPLIRTNSFNRRPRAHDSRVFPLDKVLIHNLRLPHHVVDIEACPWLLYHVAIHTQIEVVKVVLLVRVDEDEVELWPFPGLDLLCEYWDNIETRAQVHGDLGLELGVSDVLFGNGLVVRINLDTGDVDVGPS